MQNIKTKQPQNPVPEGPYTAAVLDFIAQVKVLHLDLWVTLHRLIWRDTWVWTRERGRFQPSSFSCLEQANFCMVWLKVVIPPSRGILAGAGWTTWEPWLRGIQKLTRCLPGSLNDSGSLSLWGWADQSWRDQSFQTLVSPWCLLWDSRKDFWGQSEGLRQQTSPPF